jgi:isoamyl acetate esterase
MLSGWANVFRRNLLWTQTRFESPMNGALIAGMVVRRPQFVAFGDSITQFGSASTGWLTLLADAYTRKADIVNRGFSGYNTAFALELLKTHINTNIWPSTSNDLVFLFYGTNDAVFSGYPQHVPLEVYEQNLLQLIDLIRTKTPRVILITPPQCDPQVWADFRGNPVNRRREQTLEYVNRVKLVGEKANLPVIDLWNATTIDCLCDGLHLNAKGNSVLASQVLSSISSSFPNFSPAALHTDGPNWDDFATLFPSQ